MVLDLGWGIRDEGCGMRDEKLFVIIYYLFTDNFSLLTGLNR
jgi:hypothetical protein